MLAAWQEAEFGGDGDAARMALQELAENPLGGSESVHGSAVEVPDARVECCFKQQQGMPTIRAAGDPRTPEA
ncbi:hypothetical protein GCM10022270_14780 [Terriglobus aquaticus]